MKKVGVYFIIITLIMTSTVFAAAPVPANVKVFVSGKAVTFDQEPVIISGRTLVPLRAIFEALGAKVEWHNATRTVTATRGSDQILLQVGNKTATVNNKAVTLDVEPIIISGRTLVPARFIAESFGMVVNWDEKTRTISIAAAAHAKAEELLKAGCTQCHDLSRVYMKRPVDELNRWIDFMTRIGSYPWKDSEIKIIKDYLLGNYGIK